MEKEERQMKIQYMKQYSPAMGCEMECKIYGQKGRPVLFIPCQDGRFFDFENFHMTDVWSPWLESGQVTVFSIDTVDRETWSDYGGDPAWRIRRYEQWIRYITDEMVPFMRETANTRNGWTGYPGVMVCGCSLGASHAANLYFQRPDLFDRLMALSGIYSSEFGFGSYMDEAVYRNSPIHYLGGMPKNHPYIALYNLKKAVICVGQGDWELPDSTRQLEGILKDKGIQAWVDYWGYDCSHDWYWWFKQTEYFLPYLLDNS